MLLHCGTLCGRQHAEASQWILAQYGVGDGRHCNDRYVNATQGINLRLQHMRRITGGFALRTDDNRLGLTILNNRSGLLHKTRLGNDKRRLVLQFTPSPFC